MISECLLFIVEKRYVYKNVYIKTYILNVYIKTYVFYHQWVKLFIKVLDYRTQNEIHSNKPVFLQSVYGINIPFNISEN